MFVTSVLIIMLISGFIREFFTLAGQKPPSTTENIYVVSTIIIILFLNDPIIFSPGVIALLVVSLVSFLLEYGIPKTHHNTLNKIDALISIVLLVSILLHALFYVTGR